MVGIYNKADNSLLERCKQHQLDAALKDWAALGYETCVGPAFRNLILLSVG